MGRAPCCDKANVKKGPWSPEEDAKLKSYIEQNGTGGNWIALPQKIGLKRCGKSCRLRWLNYLRPNIRHGGFSEEEDDIICSLYINIGSRWSIIAAQLPGRTDNDIKNYWNTRLKKKLLGKQRKEQAISAQARRRSENYAPKQEMKRENIHGSPNFDDNNIIDHRLPSQFGSYHVTSETPYYWPEQLLTTPAQASNQSYGGVASQLRDVAGDQQASIKNLLAKLGGRFSDAAATANNYAYPPTNHHHHHHHLLSSSQDHVYQASTFDMLTSSTYGGEPSSVHQTVFQLGLENLQAELSELINHSSYEQADDQLAELDGNYYATNSDGLCGLEYQMVNKSSTISASNTSLDSSSSNSLVYPSNMVSDYGQLTQHSSAFDQVSSSCYFGTNDSNMSNV